MTSKRLIAYALEIVGMYIESEIPIDEPWNSDYTDEECLAQQIYCELFL